MSSLPALVEVSFTDPHFGSCPIIRTEGYWNFALCYLKKVSTRLDETTKSTCLESLQEEEVRVGAEAAPAIPQPGQSRDLAGVRSWLHFLNPTPHDDDTAYAR